MTLGSRSVPPPDPGRREPTTDRPPADGPRVALRVVTTHADRTRRVDVVLQGATSVAIEDGEQTLFSTERLWPVVRDLLPPVDLLRAHPRGAVEHEPRLPGPGFVEECLAHVSIATLVDVPEVDDDAAPVSLRTWLVTADDLWAVEQVDAGTRVQSAAPGALADLLVWDVTAAMESLVRLLEEAS